MIRCKNCEAEIAVPPGQFLAEFELEQKYPLATDEEPEEPFTHKKPPDWLPDELRERW